MPLPSPGQRFRDLLPRSAADAPLQIVGAINAYAALQAQHAGHRALYLSGGGVAYASNGLPDLGITHLEDVLEDARRITAVCPLPLLADIDTGWGGAFTIARAIRSLEQAGVAAIHLEDQVLQKRCGHRPNKAIVPLGEMLDRVKAAVDARRDESFFIMARTDAIAVEGLQAGIDRACACLEAGADGIFPEALSELEQYAAFRRATPAPILANITEFGRTPLFNVEELGEHGVAMVLYPLSAFRAMSRAAQQVYASILERGDQRAVLESMQTRAELYEVLDYHRYERKLDELFGKGEREE